MSASKKIAGLYDELIDSAFSVNSHCLQCSKTNCEVCTRLRRKYIIANSLYLEAIDETLNDKRRNHAPTD